MKKQKLIIATRQSPLALQQTYWVKDLLLHHFPHLSIELLGLTTQADKILDISLAKIGGKGLFVKELEEALLSQRADLAVHSMKDVPMELPAGLCLAAMPKREDARDVFVSTSYASYRALPTNARIGTSSLRRELQFKTLCPDVSVQGLRGNIQTRLKKLQDNHYEAIILASAGLKRMGLDSEIREYFSIEEMIPAAGQGAIGIECREMDKALCELLAKINDVPTQLCVTAERALTKYLGGGCSAPVAAYAALQQDELILQGMVSAKRTELSLQGTIKGSKEQAHQLGCQLAEQLIARGARERLQEFNL